jgi:hypothetical protein
MADEAPDAELEQFRKMAQRVGEQFNDFLLLVRLPGTSRMAWRSRDDTWGIGAAKRYLWDAEKTDSHISTARAQEDSGPKDDGPDAD